MWQWNFYIWMSWKKFDLSILLPWWLLYCGTHLSLEDCIWWICKLHFTAKEDVNLHNFRQAVLYICPGSGNKIASIIVSYCHDSSSHLLILMNQKDFKSILDLKILNKRSSISKITWFWLNPEARYRTIKLFFQWNQDFMKLQHSETKS